MLNHQPLLYLFKTIIFSILIHHSLQLPPCLDVELSGYKYSLSNLASLDQINILSGSEFVSINLCNPISCSSTSTDSGYALVKKNETICEIYTSNETGPLIENYKLINPSAPLTGIQMEYIPSYSETTQETTGTIQIGNENMTFINVTQTSTLKKTKFKIYCNSDGSKVTNCTKTSVLKSNTTITTTLNKLEYENTLTCDLHMSHGCPSLALNGFWKFLEQNRIVFAIIIWIAAFYLIIFGYLGIRITILLYGILTGTFFGVLFIAETYTDFYTQSSRINIFVLCLSILLGVLYGIILLTMPKIGYINIGVFVAMVLALLLQNAVLFLTGSLLAFYITFGAIAFVMIIVSLMALRYFIIVCTSLTGAFLFIRPLGFFIPGYPNELISGANFKISVATPWQFYLYLGSIVVLTILGIIIQRCINKKAIKNKEINGEYYLEEDGSVRDKLKQIFQFQEIKDMIKAGKKEFVQLKNMIADDSDDENIDHDGHGQYYEMEKMDKIQKKNKEKETEQKEKDRKNIKSKKEIKRPKSLSSEEVESENLEELEEIRDSDSVSTPKKIINKNKNKKK